MFNLLNTCSLYFSQLQKLLPNLVNNLCWLDFMLEMSPRDGMSLNEPRDKIIQDFWIILESRDQPLPGSFPAAIKNVEKTNTIAISH